MENFDINNLECVKLKKFTKSSQLSSIKLRIEHKVSNPQRSFQKLPTMGKKKLINQSLLLLTI